MDPTSPEHIPEMTDASQRIFIVCDEGFSSSRRRQRCANAALDGPATSSALRGSRHAGMDEVTVVGRACWNRDVKSIQSFEIERACNISCNISWRIGVSGGHSGSPADIAHAGR
ncbi:MAG TPA: hypothetical protein VF317_01580, partial [Dermatophilaceae bacterium]